MQARIKSIHLENFKGVKNATYQFDGKNVSAIGQNGAGKTTIFTAYMWLMADKDSDLKSNPNIRPLDTEECTPRVEVVFDIDGKEVTAAKIQKCTVKKSKTGGADAVSLSNSYEVNSVEYGERDFKKKMQEYGFDFDLFLPLSHPDVFTSQKSVDMRKILFGMVSEKSDKEIADMTDGAADVAEMLANYSSEEIRAMQNSTLRKNKENYGNKGEVVDAEARGAIQSLEEQKVDIDVAELELAKNALNEQIADNKAKQEDISKEFEEHQKASDGILELKFELNDLQRKANEKLVKQKRDLQEQIDNREGLIAIAESGIKNDNERIKSIQSVIENGKRNLQALREDYTRQQNLEFDENSLVCSYCGQEYPEERKEQIRTDFEIKKTDAIKTITVNGNFLNKTVSEKEKELKEVEATKAESENDIKIWKDVIAEFGKELSLLPQSIDISDRPEVQEIQRQIAEKEAAMNKGNSAEEIRQQLKAEGEELQKQLIKCEKMITQSEGNSRIDEAIEEKREFYRKKKNSLWQERCDCERILEQLKMVSRKKNELLTEDINKNFDIVKWQMFEYQKNGDYKDCCVPTIDNKRFGESTNTGREVLAKLDIIKGLQRFYGQSYPVFLDGAECLSDETVKRIEMDCQLILLRVTEDKELKIEMEG